MATLGQYAKAQTATGAAADSSLQALMLLMQHMAQREDRKSDREYQQIQMELLRGQLGQQQIAAKRELPGNALVQNIQQARGLKGYGDIVARAEGMTRAFDSPWDPTLLAEFPHAQSLVAKGAFEAGTGGLEKDTWSREWSSANRRVDRFIEHLRGYKDLDPSVIADIEAELRTTVGESLGLYSDQYSQMSAEALGQSLVVAELNNGLNHKEIDLSYLKGRYPEYRDAIEKIGKSSRGMSDVKGAGLRQRVGGSLKEVIKRNPDHGLHPKTIEQLENLPDKERLDLLDRINAEGAPAVFEEIEEAQPPPEPGFWDNAGNALETYGVPAGLAAFAARGAAPAIAGGLGTLGFFAGHYGKELIAKGAIPALVADLGAKGGVKAAEAVMGLIAEDEAELEQGLEALGQHTSEAKRGLLGLYSGANAVMDIARGALSAPGSGLESEDLLRRIAQYADPEFKAAREAGIREELGKLEGRDLSETEKNQQKDLQERLNTDIYDDWMSGQQSVAVSLTEQIAANPAGKGTKAMQADLDKIHENVQTVQQYRQKWLPPDEPLGPPAPPRSYEDSSSFMNMSEDLGPQGTPYGPLRPALELPDPALEPELRPEPDPLLDFLGVHQGPTFAMDSPAPHPQEVAPPLSDTVPTSDGHYAGGYPEALQLIQEMALQQAPSLELMLQGSPPAPSAGPELPPGYTTMAPNYYPEMLPPQGLSPEMMLQLIMMQDQMARAGQSPLSVGSPPVPQGF